MPVVAYNALAAVIIHIQFANFQPAAFGILNDIVGLLINTLTSKTTHLRIPVNALGLHLTWAQAGDMAPSGTEQRGRKNSRPRFFCNGGSIINIDAFIGGRNH